MLTLVLADCTIRPTAEKINHKQSEPHIVHVILLLANNSILATEHELRTIIHTRDNNVFTIEPDVDIPIRLSEFEDMIIKCAQGIGPNGIKYEKKTLMEALDQERGTRVVMSPKGIRKDPRNTMSRVEDYVVVVGGFTGGDFISPVYPWADQVISISDKILKPWTVTSEVIYSYMHSSLE